MALMVDPTTITVAGGKWVRYQVILDPNLQIQHGKLRKYFVTLRNAIAHRDIAPNNIVVGPASLRWCFGPKFACPSPLLYEATTVIHIAPLQSEALNRALRASRITAAVRVVTTACNLLRVLKRALRAMTCLLSTVVQWSEFENLFNLLILLESDWFKTHGPRPPCHRLKRLASCFPQIEGRVHNALAA
jgi:hypothetical protein